MAIKNYKKALESDNLGMIESALINIMKLKYNYPDYDYTSLVQTLDSLETADKSRGVRFMSYILKNYLLHPDRYAWMEEAQIKFDKDLYALLIDPAAENIVKLRPPVFYYII